MDSQLAQPPSTLSQTSLTLLEQVAAGGDPLAERRFYDRYSRLARTIALAAGLRGADGDDVVQETMTATMLALRERRYDRERGRFKAWFKGVLFHKIGHARRAGGRAAAGGLTRVAETADLELLTDPAAGPAAEVEAAFEREWAEALLEEAADAVRQEVEPETWQAYDLYRTKGWKPGDVARQLGIRRSAVYNASTRVIERLRQKADELRDVS